MLLVDVCSTLADLASTLPCKVETFLNLVDDNWLMALLRSTRPYPWSFPLHKVIDAFPFLKNTTK